MDYFLINAAICVELLGKAFLAGFHPSLISNDFDSLLCLCGFRQHSKKSPDVIRTIGSREVLNRCIQILPKLKDYERELVLLADVRNGIVHLGEYDVSVSTMILDPYLKFVNAILDELKFPRGDFFGDFCTFATTRIQDSYDEIEAQVYEQFAKAKVELENRFGGIDDATRAMLFQTIITSINYKANRDEPYECPVCNCMGILSGDPEVMDWGVDYDRDGNPDSTYPIVELLAYSFECRVCGLSFDSFEELEASGIETRVTMENIDPTDFYEPWDDRDEDR